MLHSNLINNASMNRIIIDETLKYVKITEIYNIFEKHWNIQLATATLSFAIEDVWI